MSDAFDSAAAVYRDGQRWLIGSQSDVAWIVDGTRPGNTITAAIPSSYEAYATIVIPGSRGDDEEASRGAHDRALAAVLAAGTGEQPWWLGFLDIGGGADVIIRDAPRVWAYSHWGYVLVQAGPQEAVTWREDQRGPWQRSFPELLFPVDRSWLLSALWDDDWRCFGGPRLLVDQLVADPQFEAYEVRPDEDMTPPGQVMLTADTITDWQDRGRPQRLG